MVVVPLEHPVAAYDEVPLADLADEQLVAGDVAGWDEVRTATPLDFPEMTVKDAFEVVASRHRDGDRADVGGPAAPPQGPHPPSGRDVAPTQVGLAWLVDNDEERLERFIGVVRGRGAPARAATSARRSRTAERRPPRRPARSPSKGRNKPVKKAALQAERAPEAAVLRTPYARAADGPGGRASRPPRIALQGPTLQRSKHIRVQTIQEVGAAAPPALTQTMSPKPDRSTPPPDVIPHPALDVPVDNSEPERSGLDKVVFGVTAAIAVAFLVWGFVSTSSLAECLRHLPRLDDERTPAGCS